MELEFRAEAELGTGYGSWGVVGCCRVALLCLLARGKVLGVRFPDFVWFEGGRALRVGWRNGDGCERW